ncbi:MAG: hypothetical protein M3168_03525, partial [Actinomycetota bacterium]|nr:hypothetical protein [Actinomycetota bacterium]
MRPRRRGARRDRGAPGNAPPPLGAVGRLGPRGRRARMGVTLGEGATPLLRAPRLSERAGVELHLKWEGAN